MAKIITEKKEVSFEVAVAYDGTEFSAEKFGSIEAAKVEAEKYEASAKGIVKQRAMKVLKPYIVPGSENIKFEDQCDEAKAYMKVHSRIQRLYIDPKYITINCIAGSLYTGNWSCLEDTAEAVYIFKPNSQDEIDAVMQYIESIKCPISAIGRRKEQYGELADIIDRYRTEYNKDDMLVGKTYMLIIVPDVKCTVVVDIHEWLSKVSAFVDDVDAKY